VSDYEDERAHRLTQLLGSGYSPERVDSWLRSPLRRLEGSWVLRLVQAVTALSVIWSACTYLASGKQRREAGHFQAWQVINAAQGKGGSAGRIEALQHLVHDRVDLSGVVLNDAWLPHIRLSKARMTLASLRGTTLTRADLS
jgi:Pentapeptide repeats (8 copies)